jgi:DNA replication protein DnaC
MINDILYKKGVPKRYLNASLKDFPDEYKILPDKGLFITGPARTGKTHLLAAMARHLQENKQDFMFVNLPETIMRLQREAVQSEHPLYDRMRTVPYLLLDDFGAEKVTDFVYTVMYTILNHRFNEMTHLSITTNKKETEIDERFTHRIFTLCAILRITP